MKKTLLVLAIAFAFAACGGNEATSTEATTDSTTMAAPATDSAAMAAPVTDSAAVAPAATTATETKK